MEEEPHARFVFVDNRYVPGSSTPISREDGQGNEYQERTLRDGTTIYADGAPAGLRG